MRAQALAGALVSLALGTSEAISQAPTVIEPAELEWAKIPAEELRCIDGALGLRGDRRVALLQLGIRPSDARVSTLVASCREQVVRQTTIISEVTVTESSGGLSEQSQAVADPNSPPQRITSLEPIFFDRLTGEPAVWYHRSEDGKVELFDKKGFHPDTGEPLLPIAREIVGDWKRQTAQHSPVPIDKPDEYGFFDAVTGNAKIWFHRGNNSIYEFFDGPGYHPSTGQYLRIVTREVVDTWRQSTNASAQRRPQLVDPNRYSFFDRLTGEPHAWYWTSGSGDWLFFDGPGYEPRTGDKLQTISKEVIAGWQQDVKRKAEARQQKCYVITRDSEQPVRYGTELGLDPITGRQCRPLTADLIERLREYEKGKRPKRIEASEPTFFDTRTGEPVVWYSEMNKGEIELFDLMGFNPESGEELLPITKEVVATWKSRRGQQLDEASRAAPKRVDPQQYSFFDPKTGQARVWYWHSEGGDWEFYDNRGYQPRTGDPLQAITKEAIASWQQEVEKKHQVQEDREKAQRARQTEEDRRRAEVHQSEERRRQAVVECDALAANPNDLRHSGAGVSYDELKLHAAEAVDACMSAIASNPKELRFQYQLGRALEFVDRRKALEIHSKLTKAKYPAAYDNLGWLMFDDKKDTRQAVTYFRRGVELNDPDSMVSLADMIDRGAYSPPKATYVKMSLYKRAADLGHQGAFRAYNDELERQQQFQLQRQERQLTKQEMQRRMFDAFSMILRNIPRH